VNGIDKINDKILTDGKDFAKNVVNEASGEVKRIISDARMSSEKKKKEIIENAENEGRIKKERIIATAKMDGKKDLLVARQSIMDEAFEKALDKMSSLPVKEYRSILENLILNSVEKGNEEIILNSKDKSKLPKTFMTNLNKKIKSSGKLGEVKVSEKEADIKGGVIISSDDIEINCSFEALLRMKREEIEPEVYDIFFSQK
jgi:V/A-type H+-transporting ATPase subunit E